MKSKKIKLKKHAWKSIILNKLQLSNKIYARKCIIKEINSKDSKEFLNNNHLQGHINSSIKLGLFYENELISLMTFGKSRYNKKYEYELLRYCNKKYVSVVGGASRLFKYFIKSYFPKNIISYCDLRYGNGNLYENLGMKLLRVSKPNYYYFRLNEKILYSRVKFQKHKLDNLLENFDSDLTEAENMFNHGFRRIWDSGNLVFEFKF